MNPPSAPSPVADLPRVLRWLRESRARWLYAFVLALSVVWLVHNASTLLGDPLGQGFDMALWLVACVLKVPCFVALALLLARVHRVLYGNVRKAVAAAALWGGLAVAIVLALAATRTWWAPYFTSDTTKYYSTVPGRYPEPGRAEWLGPWTHGVVLLCELLLAVGLAAVNALIGYLRGNKVLVSVPISIIASILLLAAYIGWFPWFHSSYDEFHGDIFSGALLFDLVLFFAAMDPYTTIAILFYMAALAGDWLILRTMRGRPAAAAAALLSQR
jgi:hypothetical protein